MSDGPFYFVWVEWQPLYLAGWLDLWLHLCRRRGLQGVYVTHAINAQACLQSGRIPFVIATLIGIACASTVKCILMLNLLRGPCLDGRFLSHWHEGGTFCDAHLSWSTHNQDPPSKRRVVSPTRLYLAAVKSDVAYSYNRPDRIIGHAKVRPFLEFRILQLWTTCYLVRDDQQTQMSRASAMTKETISDRICRVVGALAFNASMQSYGRSTSPSLKFDHTI